jgi:hypothetical protein
MYHGMILVNRKSIPTWALLAIDQFSCGFGGSLVSAMATDISGYAAIITGAGSGSLLVLNCISM